MLTTDKVWLRLARQAQTQLAVAASLSPIDRCVFADASHAARLLAGWCLNTLLLQPDLTDRACISSSAIVAVPMPDVSKIGSAGNMLPYQAFGTATSADADVCLQRCIGVYAAAYQLKQVAWLIIILIAITQSSTHARCVWPKSCLARQPRSERLSMDIRYSMMKSQTKECHSRSS